MENFHDLLLFFTPGDRVFWNHHNETIYISILYLLFQNINLKYKNKNNFYYFRG